MKGITIPTISMPVISMPSIGVPWIGVPDSGKKGLVYPSGMKEAIKAIYDPKKQGMTNYDVIEAYVGDFTRGIINAENGSGTINGQSVTITNVISTSHDIFSLAVNSPSILLKVYVTGQTVDKQFRIVYQNSDDEYFNTVLNNGINEIQMTDCVWLAIEGLVVGECNVTIKQLPTSILQDLSGNGNHAYLYGGKGKLNSGMGVYQLDMTNAENLAFDDFKRFANKVIARGIYKGNYSVFGQVTDNSNIPIEKTITLKIKGVANLDTPLVIEYGYFLSTGIYQGNKLLISEDGTYTYTFKDIELSEDALIDYIYYNRCYFGNDKTFNVDEIVIEEIPDYPDQLCYDGKMYAVCYGFPILTDYTVMADRTHFDLDDITKRRGFISKSTQPTNGAFNIEVNEGVDGDFDTYSFLNRNDISVINGITYQTKTSYNGNAIKFGDSIDTDTLTIGRVRISDNRVFYGCHGKIIIADRSFTEEEINWLKQNWDKI
jgi:hypothetical protein